MNKSNLIFCGASVAGCLLIAALAVPFASISDAQLAAAQSVIAAEELGEIDLGEFGRVPVETLTSYYMENPPVIEAGATKKVRFEGC